MRKLPAITIAGIYDLCKIPSKGGVSLLDYLSNDKMNIINYPLIKPEEQATIGGFFMQNNKCVYEVPLTKQEFVDIINRLKEATELVDNACE